MQKCSKNDQTLYLGGCPIQNAESIGILGVTFSIKSDLNQHVDRRTAKCRNSSFAFISDVGIRVLCLMLSRTYIVIYVDPP